MNIEALAWKEKIKESKVSDKEHQLLYCNELLHHAQARNNSEDIAYAYLYMADYAYYVKRDMSELDFYLSKAKQYMRMEPSRNVIQYYTLKAMNNDATYDLLSRLDAYLQIIYNGQIIGNELSVITANGNIAELFHLCHDYQTALTYGIKVYEQYCTLNNAIDINKVILLTNIVESSCYVKDEEKASIYITELINLQCDFAQYQLYLNICYLRFYVMKNLSTKALHMEQELFQQLQTLDISRDTSHECLMIMVESMLSIHASQVMIELIEYMETIFVERDTNRWLQIQKMRIEYYTLIDDVVSLGKQYQYYLQTYELVEKANQETKIKGIRANLEIQKIIHKEEILMNSNRSLTNESTIDMMSKLYNRRYFNIMLEQLQQDATLRRMGFAMFDVDYFKEYNDVYGHIKGDQVLIHVANILKNTKDQRITPCRFGGDEFICIFTNMEDAEIKVYIQNVMNQLKELAIPHNSSKCKVIVTLSIGYGSQRINHQFHQKKLLESIDQALYASKLKGRDTFTQINMEGDMYE